MLELNNIEVMYSGTILVLKGVSLAVPDAGMICLLGSNGAGKTTTLKAISGLLHTEEGEVTSGSVVFNKERIDKKLIHEIVRMGICQAVEGRRLFEHLTVAENLMLGAYVQKDYKIVKRDLDIVYNYFPRLIDRKNQVSGYLSGGEQQMVAVGRSMMGHPQLMLLDEPTLGLSPIIANEILKIVQKFNQEEKTSILLVEQNVVAALAVSEYGYVMEMGRVVLDGTVEKLRNNEDIKEFYLGLSIVGKKSYKSAKFYKRRKRWL